MAAAIIPEVVLPRTNPLESQLSCRCMQSFLLPHLIKQVYPSLEYGTIYNNSISNILEHTFGGRPKHREHGNTFIFDVEELSRFWKGIQSSYKNTRTRIVVVKEEEGECYYGDSPEDPEGSEGSIVKDSDST